MIRIAVSLVIYLVACAASLEVAEAMSTRDIFRLDKFNLRQFNKFGKEVGSNYWSWCTDDYLTYTNRYPSRATDSDPDAFTTVHMMSLLSWGSRPVLVYPNGGGAAFCLRQGKFIFTLAWSGRAVRWPDQTPSDRVPDDTSADKPRLPSMHLIDLGTREKTEATGPEIVGVYGQQIHDRVKVDADGNVYAEIGELYEPYPKKSGQPAPVPLQNQKAPKIFANDQFNFMVYAVDGGAAASGIRVYGLSTSSEPGSVGSFTCPAARPGCDSRRASHERVYYKYSMDHDPKSPLDSDDSRYNHVLYTAVPGPVPRVQRWPVAKSRAFSWPDALWLREIAMDSLRCLVLLQSSPFTEPGRPAGPKNADYLADCSFRAGRLEYGNPTRSASTKARSIRLTRRSSVFMATRSR